MFKDWKEDTDTKLQGCCLHDFDLWKLPKFCKDPQDAEKCIKLIEKHLEILKIIHLFYASRSNFPYVTLYEFSQFIANFNLLDLNEAFTVSFISASTQLLKPTENVLESHLLRF